MRHLIPYFITNMVDSNKTTGRFKGFTMFLDMSGFTNLTEHLFKEAGHEGAELMSDILNDIFSPLVELVYKKGGFIPYFAGDAFTAIFPDQEGSIVAEGLADSALEIQKVFSNRNEWHKGKEFPIRLKIGLSYGDVNWGIVGLKHKGYYFRGQAIDNCAASEHRGNINEVIVDDHFIQQCTDKESHFTCTKIEEGYYKVLESNPNLLEKEKIHITPPVQIDKINPFLPDSILNYGDSGEYREVVSIFISFKNVETLRYLMNLLQSSENNFTTFLDILRKLILEIKEGLLLVFLERPLLMETMENEH